MVVPGAAGCEWLREHGSFVLLYGNTQAGSVISCRVLSHRPYEPWDEIVILDKREHPLHAAVIVSVCTHGLATTSLPLFSPALYSQMYSRDLRLGQTNIERITPPLLFQTNAQSTNQTAS